MQIVAKRNNAPTVKSGLTAVFKTTTLADRWYEVLIWFLSFIPLLCKSQEEYCFKEFPPFMTLLLNIYPAKNNQFTSQKIMFLSIWVGNNNRHTITLDVYVMQHAKSRSKIQTMNPSNDAIKNNWTSPIFQIFIVASLLANASLSYAPKIQFNSFWCINCK